MHSTPSVHLCALASAVVAVLLVAPAGAFAQRPPTRVVVAQSAPRQIQRTVTLVGSVQPLRRSVIGSELAGRIREMPVRQGDFVQTGDVLCRLKDETLRFQHAESVARLDSLRAKLAELEAGTRKEDLERLKAALDEAAALEQKWTFEKQRLENLMENSSASRKEYNDTTSEYLAARERHAMAKAAYELGVAGPRKEVITQARHEVAAQDAVVARLAEDIERMQIKAPFDGFVTRRAAEEGEWLEVGGDVIELADLSAVLVRVNVPEQAIPYNEVGQSVRVLIDALGEWFTGEVAHVIPQADENARTFPVEIRIDNAERRLLGGMFARAVVPAGPPTAAIAVPVDAIVRRDGIETIVLVVPGREGAKMGIPTSVTTGAQDEGWIAITSGNVGPGMDVVIRGNEGIVFPMPVEVVTVDTFQAASAAGAAPQPPAMNASEN